MTNNHYQKHKERLWKEARERYQNFSEVEKYENKVREIYQNLTEEGKGKKSVIKIFFMKKQKLVEYSENYYLTQ